MITLDTLPLPELIAIFVVSTGIILFAGTRMAGVAEGIAEKTGLGQAIVGAVFLGISTSLSGTILSFYAAGQDHPALSISNAVGGIAAQTFFLALADMAYRKANLEHAASSLANLAQSVLLIILLAVPLVTISSPEVSLWGVHPTSIILIVLYLFGMYWVKETKDKSLWTAKKTTHTPEEKPAAASAYAAYTLRRLIGEFGGLALLTGGTGITLAKSAITLADKTQLNETVIGGFLTSVITSLPELVTTIAAVRRGALNLAVGDIIGGNSFDVLFLSGSDMFYRAGSLYHQMSGQHVLMLSMSILMAGILMLGMLRREKFGPINIGFESVLILLCYGLLVGLIIMG